jgi:hypothetical protein
MKNQLSALALAAIFTTTATSAAAATGVNQSNPSFNSGPSNVKKSELSQNDQDAPHGQGGYYYVGSAFGVGIVDIPQSDLDAYKAKLAADAYAFEKVEEVDDKSRNYFSGLASLGLGYTKRLANDIVLGGEVELGFPVIKPKFVLGYMVSSNDQVSINIGYNILPRLLMGKKAKANLTTFSGAGIDLAYQHFFTNGSFIRFSLLGEYYGDAPNKLLDEIIGVSRNTISYKSTVYDVKVGFAYGMQW